MKKLIAFLALLMLAVGLLVPGVSASEWRFSHAPNVDVDVSPGESVNIIIQNLPNGKTIAIVVDTGPEDPTK